MPVSRRRDLIGCSKYISELILLGRVEEQRKENLVVRSWNPEQSSGI